MVTKTCFKCETEKPRSEFYAHPMMGDGLLGKCKECAKNDVRMYRATAPAARAYDAVRSTDPERKRKKLARNQKARLEHPEKYAAHRLVHRAVKRGDLVKKPCLVCGEQKVEAHHEDHSQPLAVIWLCPLHHRRHEFGKPIKGLSHQERMVA